MSLNSHLFPRCPMRRYVASLLLGCRSDPIAPSDHTKAHHRHLGRCQGPRRRVDVLVAPRRPGGVPWCCLGVPPVWVFDRGSRGSHAEPCSPAAASGRPVAHQVCPAVLMTPFGGVFRAVRSTEHDVEPVPIIFHRWRLTRRRGGRAWDRRVRPLRRAGAAPDFPRRRCTILEVPGEFRRTGGSRWAHPRCADVCTPSARAWGNNPKSTVRAPVSPQELLPRRLHRRMDTPSRPRSAAPSGGAFQDHPGPVDTRFSRFVAELDLGGVPF